MKLEHISVSSLEMYARCGLQWYYRYVLGKVLPPKIAMVLGRSAHTAEEHNYKQKIKTKIDLPTEEVLDLFSDTYDAESKEAVTNGEDVGKLKDRGAAALREYHEHIAKAVKPKIVEGKFNVDIGGYNFLSYLDLVTEDDAVRDMKMKSKSPSKTEAEKSFQLTAYDVVYRKTTGKTPTKLSLDCAIYTKTPKTLVLEVGPRTPEQLELFEENVAMTVEAIKKGVFLPAQPDNWVCSEKWCGYYHICKYGHKRHKLFAMGGNGK